MPQSKPRRRTKPKGGGSGQTRRRSCRFCNDKVEDVDYKDAATLKRYVSEKGKIRSRRVTGACRHHQVQLSAAVKRAREMALLPYVAGVQDGSHTHRRRSRSRD